MIFFFYSRIQIINIYTLKQMYWNKKKNTKVVAVLGK